MIGREGKRTGRQRRHNAAVAALLGISLLVTMACANSTTTDGRLRVVTTIELIADMVRNVGGDRVDVVAILPSGADPHTFEASPGRVADIARADVVFVNGLGLEGNLLDLIDQNAGGSVVALAEAGDAVDANPHLWLDASLAARYAEAIRDALTAADPAGGGAYGGNAASYVADLADLDREFLAAIEGLPRQNRKLVTFHDAYLYLARRYGLEVVAVVVTAPGQEPNAQDVARLANAIREGGVPAVYKEPQFNARVLELAADDADVRVLDLLSDAYIDGVDSYVELMRFNIQQIQEGLGGK